MQEFLILLYGGTIHTDQMDALEKNQHLIKWGTYLGKVNETNFHQNGSPLCKTGQLITSSGIAELGADRNQHPNAYMIFRAKDFETILPILEECPLLESPDARIEVIQTQSNIA